MRTNTDNKMLNETNPVYNTAKMTLSILGSAGVEEAIEFADKLGFKDVAAAFDINEENKNALPQAVVQETRYEFLNFSVRKCHCTNVIDIACGFSPRGYKLASEGYNYMGIDLEAGVNALTELTEDMNSGELPGKLRYRVCDVTDPDAFLSLADEFNGPITIICEGLFMYLSDIEIRSVMEGVRRILAKHGGRFITADFNFGDIYPGIHIAILGEEEGMKSLHAMADKTELESDTKWNREYYLPGGDAKVRPLIESCGLKIEELRYYHEEENCRFYNLIDDVEIKERLRKLLLSYPAWKLKPDGIEAVDAGVAENKPYGTTGVIADNTLKLKISGRIDSITAPDFLTHYETAAQDGGFENIELDATDLVYISSAGLRVMLIMKKRLGSGSLTIKNASKAIQEILACTGFDSLFD